MAFMCDIINSPSLTFIIILTLVPVLINSSTVDQFYRATLCVSAVFAVARCLYVCMSD